MVERKRDKAVMVRLLESEATMLAELAGHEGVSVSEWIRNVIRRDHVVAFGAKPRRQKK